MTQGDYTAHDNAILLSYRVGIPTWVCLIPKPYELLYHLLLSVVTQH